MEVVGQLGKRRQVVGQGSQLLGQGRKVEVVGLGRKGSRVARGLALSVGRKWVGPKRCPLVWRLCHP